MAMDLEFLIYTIHCVVLNTSKLLHVYLNFNKIAFWDYLVQVYYFRVEQI